MSRRTVTVPVAKFDRKGRLICPTCGSMLEVPPDRWLSRGIGQCRGAGHRYAITDDVAYAVNDILKKTREGEFRKEPLKNFEETPAHAKPRQDGKRIILP